MSEIGDEAKQALAGVVSNDFVRLLVDKLLELERRSGYAEGYHNGHRDGQDKILTRIRSMISVARKKGSTAQLVLLKTVLDSLR